MAQEERLLFFDKPIILTGMWHAGTRMLVEIFEKRGVDFGRGKKAIIADNNDFSNKEFNRLCQKAFLRHEGLRSPTQNEIKRAYKILSQYFDFSRPWGFKMPFLSYMIPYMLKLFPRGQIIGIVRDSRDVVLSGLGMGVPTRCLTASEFPHILGYLKFCLLFRADWYMFTKLKKKCFFNKIDIKEYEGLSFDSIHSKEAKNPPRKNMFGALLWKESTSRLIAHRDHTRVLVLRYEDLCQNPKEIISKMLDHVGMRDYKNMEQLCEIPNKNRIGKWKNSDPKPIEEIVSITGPVLKDLGYL